MKMDKIKAAGLYLVIFLIISELQSLALAALRVHILGEGIFHFLYQMSEPAKIKSYLSGVCGKYALVCAVSGFVVAFLKRNGNMFVMVVIAFLIPGMIWNKVFMWTMRAVPSITLYVYFLGFALVLVSTVCCLVGVAIKSLILAEISVRRRKKRVAGAHRFDRKGSDDHIKTD